MTPNAPIPVNLVTGFLGVGKTTALTRLLADKPAGEYWAVIVNEFGEVGIDGATLSSSGDELNVAEVPGGCICCTTSPMLRTTLTRLARGRRPDRLLIEPSGLGHPAGIIDLLRDPFLAKAYQVRAVVTLVDPRHLDDARYTTHETWRDQIELADVLVLNKTDLADVDQLARATRFAAALYPPKLAVVEARQGAFDPDLLDLALQADRWPVQEQAGTPAHALAPRRTPVSVNPAPMFWPSRNMQNSLGAESCGWVFPAETQFDSALVAELFEEAALLLPGLTRAKGVFSTERDWYRLDWVDGMSGAAVSAYRRDSRVEFIVAGDAPPDWAAVEARLAAAMISGAESR
ncbi:CobW family GTP-binding protein [Jeongeupia chitinilytica]|uniref:Cobalamin biosynthesis protein CobW n=1 Tax=Jeongeupia chitinilytica TaxID=1041641 RepID=A0ABQ3GYY3_9NEIS|nr:CobW family GTP-binding protein [Jeongeupia chitinilytica]GHD61999.1 cobalamin biosynthesis protein CobW [Jeongeupia chitinilytica]